MILSCKMKDITRKKQLNMAEEYKLLGLIGGVG